MYLFLIRFCCSLFFFSLFSYYCGYTVAIAMFVGIVVVFTVYVCVCVWVFLLKFISLVFDFACACYISLAYSKRSTAAVIAAAAKAANAVASGAQVCVSVLFASYKVHSFCLCVAYKRVFVVFHIYVCPSCSWWCCCFCCFYSILYFSLTLSRSHLARLYTCVQCCIIYCHIFIRSASMCERASECGWFFRLRSWLWLQTYVHKCVSYTFVSVSVSVIWLTTEHEPSMQYM